MMLDCFAKTRAEKRSYLFVHDAIYESGRVESIQLVIRIAMEDIIDGRIIIFADIHVVNQA